MRRAAAVLAGAVLAVGLAVLLPATPAAACSCAMPEPVSEATLAEYDVAFTGEVIENDTDRSRGRREMVVAVAEVFKGEAEVNTLVVTPDSDAACGTDATVGTEVLFLMTRGPELPIDRFADDDELVVMACGGHRTATEADALAPGRPPDETAGSGAASEDDLLGVPGWFPIAVLFGFAALAATIVGCTVALASRGVRRRRAGSEGQT